MSTQLNLDLVPARRDGWRRALGPAVGHYTELIWRDTTHVGCAVAIRGDRAVLACRYSPPGNIDGQRP